MPDNIEGRVGSLTHHYKMINAGASLDAPKNWEI